MSFNNCERQASRFHRGDRVQQIYQRGLGTLSPKFVHDVLGSTLILGRKTPGNGPPLQEEDGMPTHYPCRLFRRIPHMEKDS